MIGKEPAAGAHVILVLLFLRSCDPSGLSIVGGIPVAVPVVLDVLASLSAVDDQVEFTKIVKGNGVIHDDDSFPAVSSQRRHQSLVERRNAMVSVAQYCQDALLPGTVRPVLTSHQAGVAQRCQPGSRSGLNDLTSCTVHKFLPVAEYKRLYCILPTTYPHCLGETAPQRQKRLRQAPNANG